METTAARRSNHGANVKRWREWRNINQDVLAEKIGVSQATLSGYEKRDKLEPEILEKVANALDIPVEAITELNDGTSINIFSGTWKDNAYASGYITYIANINPLEKVIELYERLLKSEQEKVAILQEVIQDQK